MGAKCMNCGGESFIEHGSGRLKCKGCGVTKGVTSRNLKVSDREKYLILLLSYTLSYQDIADIFGVSKQYIHKIIGTQKKKLIDRPLDKEFDKENEVGKVTLSKLKGVDILNRMISITKAQSADAKWQNHKSEVEWIFLEILLSNNYDKVYLLKAV